MPDFPEQCCRKCRARKKNMHTSDLTQRAQNYLGKLCGDKDHLFQNAANHKCPMSSRNIKKVYKITTLITCCEGLTHGVKLVVKCEKSKIT